MNVHFPALHHQLLQQTHFMKAFIFSLPNTWGSIVVNQWRIAQEHRVWQVICGNFCGLRCTA